MYKSNYQYFILTPMQYYNNNSVDRKFYTPNSTA